MYRTFFFNNLKPGKPHYDNSSIYRVLIICRVSSCNVPDFTDSDGSVKYAVMTKPLLDFFCFGGIGGPDVFCIYMSRIFSSCLHNHLSLLLPALRPEYLLKNVSRPRKIHRSVCFG